MTDADRVVLVFGGASGIGAATALRAHADGAKVMVADINVPSFEEEDRRAFCRCDIRIETDVVRAFENVHHRFGQLDVVVLSAGIGYLRRGQSRPPLTADVSPEQFKDMLDVHVKGTWLGLKYAIRTMRTRGGTIIALSSVYGHTGRVGMAPFVASKHAVAALIQAAAKEQNGLHLRINAVAPGLVRSPTITRLFPSLLLRTGPHPLDTAPTAEDVAETIWGLAGPFGRAVHGQVIEVGKSVHPF